MRECDLNRGGFGMRECDRSHWHGMEEPFLKFVRSAGDEMLDLSFKFLKTLY